MPYRNHLTALAHTVAALYQVPAGKRARLSQELGLSSVIVERALEGARNLPGLVMQYRDERDATLAERDATLAELRASQGVVIDLMQDNARLRRVVRAQSLRHSLLTGSFLFGWH
ncbi:MAG: DNA-binding transcriptional regulator LsrR (DeoR family) [Myxococcota bacterium]|jgi:DNA-binding transcriptional regulator LsrR (DeoR family)